MLFSIATWNINSVRLRMPIVETFLKTHQPDVLCLQEIKCQNDAFPSSPFRKMGYEHLAIHGQKGYHGVAIVSRIPLSDIETRDYCEMGDTRHVAGTVNIGGKKIRVHNFYVPAGGDEADVTVNPKFDHKLKFLEEMKALDADPAHDVSSLLLGDLNIAPLETDVWSHKKLLKVVSHTPVETELLGSVMEAGQWHDLMRSYIPAEEKIFTWWSYRARDWDNADKGRRLDHIWSSKSIVPNLTGINVLREARGWEKPSDHVPVIAEFKF